MGKVGIIGDEESILIFKNIGVLVHPVVDVNGAYGVLKELVKKGYSVIFITETFAKGMLSGIEEIEAGISSAPSIVIIPDKKGSSNLGLNKIRECIVRAIGTDLLTSE